jgi:hypothetical protein
MEWLYWLVGAALFGVTALALWRGLQSPSVLAGLSAIAARVVANAIVTKVTKRNTPDIEKRMQDCYRRGGKWNNAKKRCEDHK